MTDLAERLASLARAGTADEDFTQALRGELAGGARPETMAAALAHAEEAGLIDASLAARLRARFPGLAVGPEWQPELPPDEADNLTRIDVAGADTVGVGRVIKNRFRLVEEIGVGGMGTVFKAVDRNLVEVGDPRPYVALKVLSPAFSRHPAAFPAFASEARRTKELSQENIVRVYDFDRDGPLIYMTMEYLLGQSLDRLIGRPGFAGYPLKDVLAIVRAAAAGLGFAHRNGLVHCDIKPSNIFLDDRQQVKLIDFGIARALARPGCLPGVLDTTPTSPIRALSWSYASPQILNCSAPEPRDDLFSLACVTYELLIGRRPFGERRTAAEASAQRQRPARPAGLGRRAWSALARGLAFERDGRQPSVEAFAEELGRADPPLWPYAAVSAAVLALLAGGVGTAVYLWPVGPEPPGDGRHRIQQIVPPPPPPSPERIGRLADGLACARLAPSLDDRRVRLSGIAGDAGELNVLKAALAAEPGVTGIDAEVRLVPSGFCPVLKRLGPYLAPAADGIRLGSPDGVFRWGEHLRLDVDGIERPGFIRVDYFVSDPEHGLQVVHFVPGSWWSGPRRLAAGATLVLGTRDEWPIDGPFGTDLIVVTWTNRALPSALSDGDVETNALDYLARLGNAVDALAAQPDDAEAVLVRAVAVTTRP